MSAVSFLPSPLRIRVRWLTRLGQLAAGRTPIASHAKLNAVRLVVVSKSLPRSPAGWPYVLEGMLAGVPAQSILLVGDSLEPWGERATVEVPSLRQHLVPMLDRPAVRALLMRREMARIPALLEAQLPEVARVFATLDNQLPLAEAIARRCRVPLWVYVIDDHGDPQQHASILQRAERVLSLSPEMAAHIANRYQLPGPTEVLLPQCALPAPSPRPPPEPGRPLRVAFIGNVYGYHRPAFEAMAQVHESKDHPIELRVVAPPAAPRPGWLPACWQWQQGTHNDVAAPLRQADVGLVVLDNAADPARGMTVAFPVKFRDYLMHGVPILAVAPQPSCVSRLNAEVGCGVTCPPDAAALGEAVRTLSDRARLAEMGARARSFAESSLDVTRTGWQAELMASRRP